MRANLHLHACAALVGGWLCCTATAMAGGEIGTWVVIPGRPDVPVVVNPFGFDASYTVVEGDFGLSAPAQINPRIVVGPHVVIDPPPRRYYFPHSEDMPGYGRAEVLPPPSQRVTKPPESIDRAWGTSSDPLPASTDPPYPMTISPYVGPWGPGQGRDRHRDRPDHPGRPGRGH
jgi:hypothetical protein